MDDIDDIIGEATRPRVKWAISEARDVWKKHWDSKIPVDPKEIINSLGIPLKEEDLKNMDGASHFDENGLMFIMYNKNSSLVRKRFTLAHELGHIVLEHVTIGKSSQHSSNSQETEANSFAGELLVPAADLKEFMKTGFKTLVQISERYQVSSQVAYYAVKSNKQFKKLSSTAAALNTI